MKSLGITKDWDLAINDVGNLFFVEEDEELLQAVCHAIYTFSGEDPFNENNGIPYFEEIMSTKISSKNLMESYIRYETREISGVANVYLLDNDFTRIARDFKSAVSIITTNENNDVL